MAADALPEPFAAAPEHEAALAELWQRYVADLRRFDPEVVYDATSFARVFRAATTAGGAPVRILLQAASAAPGARLLGFLVARTRMPSKALSGASRLEGFVSDCYVESEARRSGVARRLHDAALAFFAGHGIRTVGLMVLAANHAALTFWETLGYRDHLRELRLDLPAPGPT